MSETPLNNPERTKLISQATLGQLRTLLDMMFSSGGENDLPPPPCLRVTSGGVLYSLMPAREEADPIYAIKAEAEAAEGLVSVRYELDEDQDNLEIKRYVFDLNDDAGEIPEMSLKGWLEYGERLKEQILNSLRQQDKWGTVWVTEQEGRDLLQTLSSAEPLESL